MCLCLSWTSVADAGELVEFRPADTFATLKAGRAYQVARTASDLGFVSEGFAGQRNFDYRSGEFSLDVSGSSVQVAVLSDDGVNVRVTDLGEITDPEGSPTGNLPGLTNLGTGQDLLNLDESLKLIPGSLSPNHRYRFEWEYLNTLHVDDSDLDGMKVFVLGGEAQLAAAKFKVELSPLDLGTPNPTPPEKRKSGETEWIEEPSEWNKRMTISPVSGSRVSPGSLINIAFELRERDTIKIRTKSPYEVLNADYTITAGLRLENAVFDETGGTTSTIKLNQSGVGVYSVVERSRIRIKKPWTGDVKLYVTCVDSGNDTAGAKLLRADKRYDVQGTLKDGDMDGTTWEVTWGMLPDDAKLPTSVNAIVGRYRPVDSANFETFTPLSDKKITKSMQFTYQYGPDLKSDGTPNYKRIVPSYEGIVVEERFDIDESGVVPIYCTTSHKDKPVSLINQSVKQLIDMDHQFVPLTHFDEYYNEWAPYPVNTSCAIFSCSEGVDCTYDRYAFTSRPKKLAEEFLKVLPSVGDVVSVTLIQNYYCNNIKLTGSMPTELTASFTRGVNDSETHEQQVKNHQ